VQFDKQTLSLAAALFAAAGCISAGLIVVLRPFLIRYALARPNARSLHAIPTPQGGGIAVIAATLGMALAGAAALRLPASDWRMLAALSLAAIGLAIVGGVDDVRPLPAAPRLLLHVALAAVVIYAMPAELRFVEAVPLVVERAVLAVALAWFVNLTNFMDGMDWMTVAEIAPVCAALAIFAWLGVLPAWLGLVALALCGAMIGFAPFNAPVARLFLGDVGSLPIGLIVGYCLIQLAARGDFAAAIVLPLYYIADSGLTLARRLARGAPVWISHREHFYQLAAARGLPVAACGARVSLVTLLLLGLAIASHAAGRTFVSTLCLAAGGAAAALLLYSLAKGAPPVR
jgi:UDP-N-acetylmuramyl pentapeptide phosphotransferase/UDP-N-acetylglucosamine-1-phosphate transferase